MKTIIKITENPTLCIHDNSRDIDRLKGKVEDLENQVNSIEQSLSENIIRIKAELNKKVNS